jgi:tRNA-specific 2-thiouridylase
LFDRGKKLPKKRVLIAMSGGVDSSVAAYFLKKEKKYDIIGVNFNLFPQCRQQSMKDARNVCAKLGIPFYSFDYRKKFKEKVIDYFCAEYASGKTPNPCAVCNEKIKFAELFAKAKKMNADYIATGHYVKKALDKKTGRYLLKKGKDKNKDQSYFLFSLTQEQLKRALFPLGNRTKEQVRALAKKIGLRTHDKPESQDICFISGRDYREFLKERLKDNYMSGLIVDSSGAILGKHKGIPFYTIGQRKGLGPHKKRVYVIHIDKKENVIVIGEEKDLYRDSLIAENVNWIGIDEFKKPIKVKARVRYKSKESEAVITPAGKGTVNVKFSKPQKAVTPGQAVVFYNKDIVIGGGWIK